MRMTSIYAAAIVGVAAFTASGAAYSAKTQSPTTLRSGPGMAWRAIGEVPAGANVKVKNCYSGWHHSWCQVRYGSKTGYVNGPALAVYGSHVRVAPVVTNDAANLQSRPSLFSSTMGVIPGGKTVDLIHCKSGIGSGWCKVAYKGKTGFIRGGLLARQGSSIPR